MEDVVGVLGVVFMNVYLAFTTALYKLMEVMYCVVSVFELPAFHLYRRYYTQIGKFTIDISVVRQLCVPMRRSGAVAVAVRNVWNSRTVFLIDLFLCHNHSPN